MQMTWLFNHEAVSVNKWIPNAIRQTRISDVKEWDLSCFLSVKDEPHGQNLDCYTQIW